MLVNFFMALRREKLPVTFTELFSLLECLKQNIAFASVDDFYYLARLCMVKDEKNFDKFDRGFARYFKNVSIIDDLFQAEIPGHWLQKQFESMLSDAEKAQIQALGGLEKLMEEFRKRMAEQKDRHQGGNKWIGTGGTSPRHHPGGSPRQNRLSLCRGPPSLKSAA